MHAVPRAVGIARVDAFKAEKEIALLPGPARRQRIGEFFRRIARNLHVPVEPRGARPLLRKKHALVTRRDRLIRKAPQINFRAAGARVAAANEAELHLGFSIWDLGFSREWGTPPQSAIPQC